MGVIYDVACKDCKVYRDLGKFYTLHFCGSVETREDALKQSEKTSKDGFKCTLLLGFLSQHYGHNIFVIDDSKLDDELDGYEEDTNFWESNQSEKLNG